MINQIFDGITYNSLAFLLFLFFFLCIFFILPKNWMKIGAIIVGNVFFYVYAAGVGQLIIIVFSSAVVYVFSRLIEKIYNAGAATKTKKLLAIEEVEYWKPYKRKSKKLLIVSISLLLFVLLYTKAGKKLEWENVNGLFDMGFGKMMVPLGLSYYTFSSVGYLIDIYKRKATCEHNPILLFASITFFPVVVEGPISRIKNLSDQFRMIPRFDYNRFCYGMQRMLWGLFKKMVIADRIIPVTSSMFSNVFEYAGVEIIIALLLNTFAFYADFSGCMDIVIGVAESMGIVLDENFKQPFLSEDVSSFWRRWHITLFSWFRDYLYMPIVKTSRMKKFNKYWRKRLKNQLVAQIIATAIPTFVVWMITGIWHGTGKDYIAWGLYWFALTIASLLTKPVFEYFNRRFRFRTETIGWKIFRILRTDFLYVIGGIIVVAGSTYGLHGCFYVLRQLVSESRIWVLFNGTIFEHGMDRNSFIIVFICIVLVMLVERKQNAGCKIRKAIAMQPIILRWIIWLSLIVAVLIWGQYGPGYSASEFVYRGF